MGEKKTRVELGNGAYYEGEVKQKGSSNSDHSLTINGKNFVPHGFGTKVFSNGDKYVGNFKNGSMEGEGTYTWAIGCELNGNIKLLNINKDSSGYFMGNGSFSIANFGKFIGNMDVKIYNYVGLIIDFTEGVKGSFIFENGTQIDCNFKYLRISNKPIKIMSLSKSGEDITSNIAYFNIQDNYAVIGNLDYNKKFEGKCKYIFLDTGEILEGKFKEGFPNNKTVRINSKKEQSIEFWEQIKDNKVSITFKDSKYIGDTLNLKIHGKGELFYNSGDKYQGEFKNGKKHGKGVFNFLSGDKFEGDWKDDKKHGKGKLTFKNGDTLEGDWENDKENGLMIKTINGIKTVESWVNGIKQANDEINFENVEAVKQNIMFNNGDKFEGLVIHGVPNGPGKMIYPNGDKFKGFFKNGVFDGRGIFFFNDGRIIKGNWKNGKYDGYITEINPQSNLKVLTYWENGVLKIENEKEQIDKEFDYIFEDFESQSTFEM